MIDKGLSPSFSYSSEDVDVAIIPQKTQALETKRCGPNQTTQINRKEMDELFFWKSICAHECATG